MSLKSLKITDFRCLEAVEAHFNDHYNLIYGANASGKTSLLEAIAYLGRGKSFRGATTQNIIRHGCSEFLLLGEATPLERTVTIGVRNSRDGLEVRIDGENQPGAAALAENLPLQIIGPDVHELVAGAPEERRRFLDWIAFHVEHGYLEAWRRFRRILKQRNAALKNMAADNELDGWDREYLDAAGAVDNLRRDIAGLVGHSLEELAEALLGCPAGAEYRQGWSKDLSLANALKGSRERDREQGSTQIGPHRGDLRLVLDEHQAKRVVSRGQQKLLACALILSATELVQVHLERPLLLLLDDPAAELDGDALNRLMSSVIGLGSQIIATALEPDSRLFPEPPTLFHMEHGKLRETNWQRP